LQIKGVSFLTEPKNRPDWGIRTAHFRDPAGNLLEIYSPLVD
jgi:lactoylglutathione lyase